MPSADHSADTERRGTIAVVLAAGAGSRFAGEGHKLDAEVGGTKIGHLAIRAAIAADIGPVVVVTGATHIDVDDLTTRSKPAGSITIVHNPHWADGQATSLRAAIDHAERHGADAVVVGLADQPFVTADAWRRVAGSNSPIAVATYAGAPRNPVRLHHSIWHLLPTDGDAGARFVIRLHPELVERVPCPGSPADIDTLEDLRQWQSRSSTNSW